MDARRRRGWAGALLAWALALTAPAWAEPRHILDLDLERQPAALLDWGDYRIDPRGDLSLHAALADRAAFRPTRVPPAYALAPGEALWIRFAVPATPDDQRWYLKIASPGLDRAVLYTLGADDAWTRQASGDAIAVSAWPIPHLYPVLPLNVSAADPTYYALRIEASEGLFAPVEFVSEGQLSAEIQRLALLYGVFLGLLAMGAAFALATSAVLRDGAYLWFGLWAAAALAGVMAATGVAGLHLWPRDARWNDSAFYLLPAVGTTPLLLFVAQALLLRERAASLYWAAVALAVGAGGCALGTLAASGPARAWLAAAAIAVGAIGSLAIGIWARHRGERFAGHLLLALAPVFAALPLHVAGLLQWPLPAAISPAWMLAALGLSVAGSYLLLALRSQERRDHRRRIAQLGEIDPTTGLVNEVVFAQRLRHLVAQSSRFGHQSVVAIVELSNLPQLRHEFGRKRSIEMLLRLSDRLTSILRNVDTVARLGDGRFGLLVEGPLEEGRVRSFCAKAIAHCITPVGGLPQGMIARPKIAAALVPRYGTDVAQLMELLEGLLRDTLNDPNRGIAVAGASRPAPPAMEADPDSMSWTPTAASAPPVSDYDDAT